MGFTLIELLGAIATVGILSLLLLPTLAKSKEKGQQIRCLGNMQQLMLATHLYANDFNNFLPYSGAFPEPQFYTNCWAYSHKGSVNRPEQGQLWPYHKSLRILMCPQENTNAPYFKPRFAMGRQTVTSYNFSASSCGFPVIREGPEGWNGGRGLKLSLFRVDAVLAWEPPEKLPYLFNDACIEPFEYCSVRHNGGTVVGCYGGGAEHMTHKTFAEEEKRKPGRLHCNPNSPDGT